jgi:hypothetical protein
MPACTARPLRAAFALLVLFFLGSLVSAGAQNAPAEKPDTSPPAVNPGRPTLTDPAALTAPGWLETEFGIQQNLNRDRSFGTPFLLKLTMNNRRLQYRLATDGYVRLGDSTDGIGDTYIAAHYLFAPQERAGYDLAGRLTIKLPTARRALGTQKVDFGALFLASRDYSRWIHADYNAGLTFLTRQNAPGNDTQLFLSASFTLPFRGGRWAYTNELTYFSPISGVRAQVTTMHGLTYAVHRYDIYDVAMQWGLYGDGATWQILFGRTFYLGHLF